MSQDFMGLKKLFLILNPSHQIFLITGFREAKTHVLQITYGNRLKITKLLLRFFVKILKNFKVLLSGSSKTLNSILYRLSVNRVLKILREFYRGDS